MARLDELFVEVEDVLRRYQPELSANLLVDRVAVAGNFVCLSDDGPFDRFEIDISVSSLFPQKEPQLFEVGGRLPRTIERHVFASSGCCCLGLWEAWLLKTPKADFESYLLGPVTSYFVSQWFFEATGDWPFGEQGHSAEAIADTYAEALNLPADADRRAYLRHLTAPLLAGNPLCPCRSGARLRDCHWRTIREQRRRIPAFVRKGIANRFEKFSKE